MTFTEKLDKTWKEWPWLMGFFSLLSLGFAAEGLAWLVNLSRASIYVLYAGYAGVVCYLVGWPPAATKWWQDWRDERASKKIAAEAGVGLGLVRLMLGDPKRCITREEAQRAKAAWRMIRARAGAAHVNLRAMGCYRSSTYSMESLMEQADLSIVTEEMEEQTFAMAMQAGGILLEEFRKLEWLGPEELQEMGQELAWIVFDVQILMLGARKSGLTLAGIRAQCREQVQHVLSEEK